MQAANKQIQCSKGVRPLGYFGDAVDVAAVDVEPDEEVEHDLDLPGPGQARATKVVRAPTYSVQVVASMQRYVYIPCTHMAPQSSHATRCAHIMQYAVQGASTI